MAFDLEAFAATSDRVRWEDLDFDEFDTRPLDDETLRACGTCATSNTTPRVT